MPIKDHSSNQDRRPVWFWRTTIQGQGVFSPRHLGLPDERFVFVHSEDEARAVEAKNDPAAVALKADRARYVRDHGPAHVVDLPDVNAALEREVLTQAGLVPADEGR
jgi:hypothetical protein